MRPLLILFTAILTLGAGVPSAPVEMLAHCGQHQMNGGHHESAPQQHQHGETHCPEHSCASTTPCTSITVLIRGEPTSRIAGQTAYAPDPVRQVPFSTRDIRPAPPPPRSHSA